MDCEQFTHQLNELAAVGPDIALPAELHAHQAGCDKCRQRLVDAQEAWLLLSTALPKSPLPPDLEARVLARIESAPTVPSAPALSQSIWKYVLAASVLFTLAGGAMWTNWFNSERLAVGRDADRVREIARQLGKLEELEKSFASPGLRYVSLTTAGSDVAVQGYLVCDRVANEGHFFGFNLVASGDRRFVLWLLNANQEVVSSVNVAVDSKHRGAALISLPPELLGDEEILVSVETAANPVAPSRNVRMRSQLER